MGEKRRRLYKQRHRQSHQNMREMNQYTTHNNLEGSRHQYDFLTEVKLNHTLDWIHAQTQRAWRALRCNTKHRPDTARQTAVTISVSRCASLSSASMAAQPHQLKHKSLILGKKRSVNPRTSKRPPAGPSEQVRKTTLGEGG